MPKLTRRNFLKLGAAAGTLLAGGSKTLHAMELKLGGEDRHQIRPFHPRATYNYVCTLCPYHDSGIAFVEDGHVVKLEGNPDHIATRGKFCPKGMAGLLAAYDPDRILYPLKRTGQRGSGQWKRITWDEAIKEVSTRIKTASDKGAAKEVVLNTGEYKDSALLRFMQTIGSDSVFRSRALSLSNPNKKKALEDAFGVDTLTPDFANARYVLNFGANIVETAFPFAQRLTDAIVEKRLKLVTFDVRLSNTAGRSDEWFPIFTGTDGIVMLAMANVIMSEGLADIEFLKNWTNYPVDKLTLHLKQFTPEKASEASGVNAEDIKRIALEFAETKPNVVFTQNGITYHSNGMLQERAAVLLSAITGSIDAKGGLCLPRKFDIQNPKLSEGFKGSRAGTHPKDGWGFKDAGLMNYALPFKIKDGSQKASVFLNYMSNPAYSSPAASIWRDVLKDEKLIPFIVDFSPFMSETAELADIILPDVVSVERHDVASSPTALKPWVSITMPFLKPQGEAMDARVVMQKIVKAIDTEGKGIASSWDFKDEADYVKRQVEETAAIKDKYEDLTKSGMYPVYGKLDSKGRKIVDENGKMVEGEFSTYKKNGFATASKKIQINIKELEKIGLALPVWQENLKHKGLKPNEFILTTFKWAYHANSRTGNLKYLSEIIHSNPVWINKKEALRMGINDGGLVRVVSPVGHIVTKAFITNGINPKVVAIGASVGRWAYGRVAQANLHMESPVKSNLHDNDIDDNLWWRDKGVNPNDIIPVSIDVIGGGQAWFDTVIKIESAHPEDKYGDVMVDNNKHMNIYKETVKS